MFSLYSELLQNREHHQPLVESAKEEGGWGSNKEHNGSKGPPPLPLLPPLLPLPPLPPLPVIILAMVQTTLTIARHVSLVLKCALVTFLCL